MQPRSRLPGPLLSARLNGDNAYLTNNVYRVEKLSASNSAIVGKTDTFHVTFTA